jgi:hypothetical protein
MRGHDDTQHACCLTGGTVARTAGESHCHTRRQHAPRTSGTLTFPHTLCVTAVRGVTIYLPNGPQQQRLLPQALRQ